MKRLILITTWVLLSLPSVAQKRVAPRLHPENLTEYPSVVDGGSRRVGLLSDAPLGCTGSPRVPVVLVQFADKSFSVAETEAQVNLLYQEFFNAAEGVHPATSYSSVSAYFKVQSGGLFTPVFDVIGPVTLSKGFAYYGEDSGSSKDVHIQDFFSEACQLAVQEGKADWTDYDNDGNGVIDMVFFIYAGAGQNEDGVPSSAIWPKEKASTHTIPYQEGILTFGAYGCTNELYYGEIDGIGTCVHELCHALGLPDFYDTNYEAFGLDYWDVMDSGCYQMGGCCPCGLSAYELDFMGWRQLVTLEPGEAYSLTLLPMEQGGVAYKVVNAANPDEYFILENRQSLSYDRYLGWPVFDCYQMLGANHGLMITHVDYLQSAWIKNAVNTDAAHQRITIVPADGELLPERKGMNMAWARSLHGDLYPGPLGVTEMSSYQVFTGGSLGQNITNIVEHEDGSITLDINGGEMVEPDVPEIAQL